MVPMFGTQSVTFWYPTSSSQYRTIVRPPNHYLPLSLTLKGREGVRGGSAPLRNHRSLLGLGIGVGKGWEVVGRFQFEATKL